MEIGPGKTFNFMVANFDEEATERQFYVFFANSDGSVREEQSYVLVPGEEMSVDFYKVSFVSTLTRGGGNSWISLMFTKELRFQERFDFQASTKVQIIVRISG